MDRICIIPAKRHSRRVPRKNHRLFMGKPMLAYPIEAAQKSGLFNMIVVSTEDGQVIAPLARELGAAVVFRPPHMVRNKYGTQQIAQYTLKQLAITRGQACCIYPATPLLKAEDIHLINQHFLTVPPVIRYAYITGWLYWGMVRDFLAEPEITHPNSVKFDHLVGERWVDIDWPADLARAEFIYRHELRRAA